jgi:hypothetical protein
MRVANNSTTSSSNVLPESITSTLPTKGKAFVKNNSIFAPTTNEAIVVSKFSIYPNPASNTVTLNLPTNQTTTITFTDMLGNEVLVQNSTLKMKSDDYTITEVSVEPLPKGIYFVTAKTATQQFVSKLVKE